jgi:hypothetical protein
MDTSNDESDNIPDNIPSLPPGPDDDGPNQVGNGTVPLPYTPPPPPPPPPETIIRPVYPTDSNRPPFNPLAPEGPEHPEHPEPVEHETNPQQGETPIENDPPPEPPVEEAP